MANSKRKLLKCIKVFEYNYEKLNGSWAGRKLLSIRYGFGGKKKFKKHSVNNTLILNDLEPRIFDFK